MPSTGNVTASNVTAPAAPREENGGSGLLRFEPAVMTWRSWQFRYRNYIKLRKVTDTDEQKAILLDAFGVDAMDMLHSCGARVTRTTTPMPRLWINWSRHTSGRPTRAVEWAMYFQLQQEAEETLVEFSNKLRRNAINCNFPGDVLEKNISSMFLNGMASNATQQHLITKDFTTLEKALQMAQQYELAKTTKRGQASTEVTEVAIMRTNAEGRGQSHSQGQSG
ncbi:uncharacterized protein LOC129597883 [Paramacrobiotus metropolitanus]|uniref:uncharacterized protein LOC129597883 n=1 Tax=Paramacrobiotus metropolitanus TaxID=2943436 RepID=UPI00244620A3|nr:uncharacterized protein LOC129597883 [Paramacrobiotus metropolitanus]